MMSTGCSDLDQLLAQRYPDFEIELIGHIVKRSLDPDNLFNPGKIFDIQE